MNILLDQYFSIENEGVASSSQVLLDSGVGSTPDLIQKENVFKRSEISAFVHNDIHSSDPASIINVRTIYFVTSISSPASNMLNISRQLITHDKSLLLFI